MGRVTESCKVSMMLPWNKKGFKEFARRSKAIELKAEMLTTDFTELEARVLAYYDQAITDSMGLPKHLLGKES